MSAKQRAIEYLLGLAKEPSTWRGVVLVGTAIFGWKVSEEQKEAVLLIGLFVAGFIGVFFPDRGAKKRAGDRPPQ